jgi:hypothetical protein
MNSNNSKNRKQLILVKQKRNYKNTETDLKATYEQARWKKEGKLAPLENTQSRRQQKSAQKKKREKWLQRNPTPFHPPARPCALRAATPTPNTHTDTTLTEEKERDGNGGRRLGNSKRTWGTSTRKARKTPGRTWVRTTYPISKIIACSQSAKQNWLFIITISQFLKREKSQKWRSSYNGIFALTVAAIFRSQIFFKVKPFSGESGAPETTQMPIPHPRHSTTPDDTKVKRTQYNRKLAPKR